MDISAGRAFDRPDERACQDHLPSLDPLAIGRHASCQPDDAHHRIVEHAGTETCFLDFPVAATGKKVIMSATGSLKRLTLEIGGNDAGIVLPDADPALIAKRLFWCAFINNGQTCAALKRLYVHDGIYDDVCTALVNFARSIRVGDGTAKDSMLGVQNAMQHARVTELVNDAKAQGARVLIGGEASQSAGYFYPITCSRMRPTACASSTRSSSAPRCRSFATAASKMRSPAPTPRAWGWVARSGPATYIGRVTSRSARMRYGLG